MDAGGSVGLQRLSLVIRASMSIPKNDGMTFPPSFQALIKLGNTTPVYSEVRLTVLSGPWSQISMHRNAVLNIKIIIHMK